MSEQVVPGIGSDHDSDIEIQDNILNAKSSKNNSIIKNVVDEHEGLVPTNVSSKSIDAILDQLGDETKVLITNQRAFYEQGDKETNACHLIPVQLLSRIISNPNKKVNERHFESLFILSNASTRFQDAEHNKNHTILERGIMHCLNTGEQLKYEEKDRVYRMFNMAVKGKRNGEGNGAALLVKELSSLKYKDEYVYKSYLKEKELDENAQKLFSIQPSKPEFIKSLSPSNLEKLKDKLKKTMSENERKDYKKEIKSRIKTSQKQLNKINQPVVTDKYISKGSYDGAQLYEGKRGGLYYLGKNNSRVYINQQGAVGIPEANTEKATKSGNVSKDSSSSSKLTKDAVVGIHTSSGSANGAELLQGANGGTYYLNSSGNKTYVKPSESTDSQKSGTASKDSSSSSQLTKDAVVGIHTSSGSANGAELLQGANGGTYYLNSSGNKTYVKPSESTDNQKSGTASKDSSSSSQLTKDAVVGIHTSSGSANGAELLQGANGGTYYLNSSGNKTYVKPSESTDNQKSGTASKDSSSSSQLTKDAVVGIHTSSGSANGAELLQGANGGTYYLNSSGNKTYVKPSESTSNRSANTKISSGYNSGSSNIYISSGSANGSHLMVGPRGGTYYINSSGKKSYVR